MSDIVLLGIAVVLIGAYFLFTRKKSDSGSTPATGGDKESGDKDNLKDIEK
jgi:LPXTG-motif cell wall-anchored protein